MPWIFLDNIYIRGASDLRCLLTQTCLGRLCFFCWHCSCSSNLMHLKPGMELRLTADYLPLWCSGQWPPVFWTSHWPVSFINNLDCQQANLTEDRFIIHMSNHEFSILYFCEYHAAPTALSIGRRGSAQYTCSNFVASQILGYWVGSERTHCRTL